MSIPIVIPLHAAGGKFHDNTEVRYALRSLEKHFKDPFEVHVITDKLPEWMTGVNHIHTKGDLKVKQRLAAEHFPEGFFFTYDDCCLVRDMTAEEMKITPAGNGGWNGTSAWGKQLAKILRRLKDEGFEPRDYSHPHGPYFFDKEMFDMAFEDWPKMSAKFPVETWMLSKREWPYRIGVVRQYYANEFSPPGEGAWFLNYNDSGFTGRLREYLDGLYPEMSRFEKTQMKRRWGQKRSKTPETEVPALMIYGTKNLGDYTQMMAVTRLMPEPGMEVNREELSKPQGKGRMVMAGWFKDREGDWPPHPDIRPLFVSFHAWKKGLVTQHADYLKHHAPIGCRDQGTVELCQKAGIDAYFSGCVTLTLDRPKVRRGRHVLFIDAVAPQGIQHARYCQMSGRKALEDFREDTEIRLEQLAAARCVVTSRLHIAMPCAAVGTPCLLLGEGDRHMVRFKGLSQFVTFLPKWNDAAIREFVEAPPKNPNSKLRKQLAAELREKIRSFYETKPEQARAPFVSAGPPEGITKLTTIAATGCDWKVAIPSYPGVPMDGAKVRGDVSMFRPLGKFHEMVPERGVAFLEGGSTYGSNGWVVTPAGELVVDLSWFPCASTAGFRQIPFPKAATMVRHRGSCLDLSSNWGYGNYAHWLLEAVGRVPVLELAGLKPEDFDYIRLPDVSFKQAQIILDAVGLPKEKLVRPPNPYTMMQFDLLVKPTIAGIPKQFHHSLPDFYRRVVKLDIEDGPERVFLRRTARLRKLTNAEEIEGYLESRGFEIIDPAKHEFGRIASAKVIISGHQAGLADMMFAAPGANVLELLPTDQQSQYYQSLARQSGHHYECLMAPSTNQRDRGYGVSPYNYRADVKEIGRYLDDIGV